MRARIFAEDTRKWFTLAAVSFGLFMIMLDNTVVNVALPAIQEDLGTDLSQLQWIVTGYALTFAATAPGKSKMRLVRRSEQTVSVRGF